MSTDMVTFSNMASEEYLRMWRDAWDRRSILTEERTTLEERNAVLTHEIDHLNEVVKHLGRLAGVIEEEKKFAGVGITDAMRGVLQESTEGMTAQDVLRVLTENGFDTAKYSAPMSSIYKILSRLESAGDITREAGPNGLVYAWKKPDDYANSTEITDDDIPF